MYLFVALLTLFSAGTLWAATSVSTPKSDLFFQASPGQSVFSPRMEFDNTNGTLSGTTDKIKDSGQRMILGFERGFGERFSAGLEFVLRNGQIDNGRGAKVEAEGVDDLRINLRGAAPVERPTGNIHYGAFIRHSLKRTTTTRLDFNGGSPFGISKEPHSAGSSATPYIGYSEIVGRYVLGARLMQTVWGTDRKEVTKVENVPAPFVPFVSTGRERIIDGGGVTELKVFAEREFGQLRMNIASRFRHTAPEKQTDPVETVVTDEMDLLGFSINPSYRIDDQAEIVGSAAYTTLLNQNILYEGETIKRGEISSLTVGGRFSF